MHRRRGTDRGLVFQLKPSQLADRPVVGVADPSNSASFTFGWNTWVPRLYIYRYYNSSCALQLLYDLVLLLVQTRWCALAFFPCQMLSNSKGAELTGADKSLL